jgi:hypothetical protein
MIVERVTWKVGYRHQKAVIELLKATVQAMGFTPASLRTDLAQPTR